MVPRTGGYAHDVGVWDSSIIQGPVAPLPNLRVTIRNVFIRCRAAAQVRILDLTRACLTAVEHVEPCVRLDCLNLSFNCFRSVQSLPARLGAVTRLVLRGNELESTAGLERLYALEGLDLASNLITCARPLPSLPPRGNELESTAGLERLYPWPHTGHCVRRNYVAEYPLSKTLEWIGHGEADCTPRRGSPPRVR
jgi:hypothetical protein